MQIIIKGEEQPSRYTFNNFFALGITYPNAIPIAIITSTYFFSKDQEWKIYRFFLL